MNRIVVMCIVLCGCSLNRSQLKFNSIDSFGIKAPEGVVLGELPLEVETIDMSYNLKEGYLKMKGIVSDRKTGEHLGEVYVLQQNGLLRDTLALGNDQGEFEFNSRLEHTDTLVIGSLSYISGYYRMDCVSFQNIKVK